METQSFLRWSAQDVVRQVLSLAAGRPAIVVTDFANPALRRQCEDVGLGYLDTTGWAYLRDDHTGLFVRAQGAARAPSTTAQRPSATRNLAGPGASKVVRALWDATPPIGVRSLAERAQVSPGTAAKALPTLSTYGAVVRNETGRILQVDRRLLLERWTQDYGIYTSNPQVLWRLSPRGTDRAFNGLMDLDAPGGEPSSYTGWAAALTYLPKGVSPVIPNTLLSVYSPDPDLLSETLELKPATRQTANVVLIRPRDSSILRPFPQPAPLPQVVADLMSMGGRFDELAEQLLETTTPGVK